MNPPRPNLQTIDAVAGRVPEPLARFMSESCGLPPEALQMHPASALPVMARQLLVHDHDMTSMLAAHHASTLRVNVLQTRQYGDNYLREVFLRGDEAARVVEYGIIAIRLDQFTAPQRRAIQAGRTPLGALLHEFHIPFESHPIGFFSLATDGMDATRRAALNGAMCYGRFNQLARKNGEPLAWIMEVLPAE